MREVRTTMTPREKDEFEQEKEIARLQADYQLLYKEKELELKRVEMRWTQVFRLPFAILMLPVRFLFGVAYVAHAIKGSKPEKDFWELLRRL